LDGGLALFDVDDCLCCHGCIYSSNNPGRI
jgi:hypothetical protein